MWKKWLSQLIIAVLLIGFIPPMSASAAGGITLYTPYTGISVTPGESLSYDIEVTNDSSDVQRLQLSVDDLPEGWSYQLSSNSKSINELAVAPNGTQNFTIDLEVPLQIEKGNYQFDVVAESDNGTTTTLPITVNIAEEGTFQTDLSVEQPNMEGDANATFTYSLELSNRTAEEQTYALSAKVPEGWQSTFKADGNNVTSVTVDSRGSQTVEVEINPAENVKKGTYEIPITAQSGQTNSEVVLESVITGTYSLNLTTSDGRLSGDIKAGDETTLDLVVENNGTSDLSNISLSSDSPSKWEVEFSESQIDELKAGASTNVKATVKASDQAIAGDYAMTLTASAQETSSEAQFRMSVKTSMLWGWIGVLLILGVAASLFFLIRKYGRR
ncbi:NEW3 domain-containing protein [Piscibacillus halophilus]|uniref:NEW3 domain-containing protein n=1 Tax=Piscibacillus halophilus TaxID=571933 RepID=UPI00158C1FE6|nr:NEW3 domain-containing protein [Piscibacillus halophilus]